MGAFRFLLAASVAVAHAGFLHLHFGPVSIQLDSALAIKCFFVLSGFYMATLLDGPYRNDPARFYLNRALRIFPMYWLIAALAIAFGLTLGSVRDVAVVPSVLLFGGQYLATDRADLLVVPPAWTLGVELMFYALAPLLAKRSSLFLLVLAVVLARLKGADLYSWIGQLPLFIVGMLVYRGKFIPAYNSRIDRWLGDLSYPLYLVHYPVVVIAMPEAPLQALALSVVLAIALKYALAPIERVRSRVRGPAEPLPTGAMAPQS